MQALDDKLDAIFSVTPEAIQRMVERAPVEGEPGLFSDNSQVQQIADAILQDMEDSSQDCDITMHGLDVETPQDDALEQQLAQMEAHLQHIYGVNEDLQAELQDTQWTSADSRTKMSRELEHAERKAKEQEKAADAALIELRGRKRDMEAKMKNKEAELLYEQAKAAAQQQNLEAALAQHAQEEMALQMQLQQERIRAEKAEDKAEEAKGRADKAEGYLKEANAQVDNLERQLNKAFEEVRKVAIGIHRAVNPHHEGKVHWAGSLRTAQDQSVRMRLLLEEALQHNQESQRTSQDQEKAVFKEEGRKGEPVPESPESLPYNDPCTWEVPSTTPTTSPHSLCESPAPNGATSRSPTSSLDGSDASTLSAITPFEGVLQQMVATPSPATAAAMVRSPMPSSGQLVAAPGPDIASGAALVSPWTDAATPEHLWDTSTLTPATASSLSFMERLSPDMVAHRVVGSPLAGQAVANPVLSLSPWSDATTPEHLWDTSSLTPMSRCSLSPMPSHGSMSPGGALLWKVPSPAATFTQEPLCDTPSHTTPTTIASSASSACWGDSCAFPPSSCSSFEGVLRQMVATPSPATAAAMVRTPPASSSPMGLRETPGPRRAAAAVLCSPSFHASGQMGSESPGSSPGYSHPYLSDCPSPAPTLYGESWWESSSCDSAIDTLSCLSGSPASFTPSPSGQLDSESSGSSPGLDDSCMWESSSPAPDFFPPAHTLFCESEWESSCSSSDSATSWSQSASLSGSPDSWLSPISPFERVLQQMVATPSPATAAAMVCSPPASSPMGLMETPGPESPAAVLCSPCATSSGQLESGSLWSSPRYNDPVMWDFSSPVSDTFPAAHTLFGESPMWESSSCASASDSLSSSSSLSGSPDSWLSAMSPFARVLQHMVATPSPATAAAMVRSPMPTPGQLVAAPSPNTAAPRVCSPSAGQLVAAPGQDMAASTVRSPSAGQLVAALSPDTAAAVEDHRPPSAQSVASAGPDRNTAAPEASRPLSRQKLATTSALPSSDGSPGSPPSAVHSPTFSGSPVAGLCRSGIAGSQIRVRTTLKQQARQEAVAQRMATPSSGPTPPQRIAAARGTTTASPTAGPERVAFLKRRLSVSSGSKSLASKLNSSSGKENSPLPGKVATPSLGQQETPFRSKVETPMFGSANTPAKVARVQLFSPALTATGTVGTPLRTPLAPMTGGVDSAPGITPQALHFHHVAVPFWGLQAPAATMEVPLAAATLPTVTASRLAPPSASSSATSSSATSSCQITPGSQSAASRAASTTTNEAKEARPRGSKRRTASAAAPVASQIVTRSQAAAQKHVERMQTRSMQTRSMQSKRFK